MPICGVYSEKVLRKRQDSPRDIWIVAVNASVIWLADETVPLLRC